MDSEKLKMQVGCNIAACRKRSGMTQAELALKLNYTDKAVSKWERGESVPDLPTLIQLAELFGISLDALTADPNALPDNTGAVQQTMGRVVEKTLKRKADKRIIVWLCSLIVWSLATLVFVVTASARISYGWLAFLFAVPADAIVVLSLRSAWRDFRSNLGLISVILWGSLACVFAVLALAIEPFWLIFLLGIPGQLAIFLWFRLFRTPKEEKDG